MSPASTRASGSITRSRRFYGRVEQLAVAAAAEAVAQASLDAVDKTRVGVLVSTGQGAVEIFEEQIAARAARGPRAVSPYFIPGVMLNAVSALLSIRHRFMGPSFNIASACATASHSIATSALMILAGEADVMLAGGGEAATVLNTVAGFGNARALARAYEGDPGARLAPLRRRSQRVRHGEGAGALVLEAEEHAKKRGAKVLAYLVGWGMTTDAEHVTRPHPEGSACASPSKRPSRRAGDQARRRRLHQPARHLDAAGRRRRVPVDEAGLRRAARRDPDLGHQFDDWAPPGRRRRGRAIAVVCSLLDQLLHPSINVDRLDPVFEIDLVREARRADVRYAISNSAGFGGHNCVLTFERA